MRKYLKELIILFFQLFMFYIFPLFAGPTDAMGMVLLILIATFILSLILGCLSGNKGKFLYPVLVAVLFLPSIFLYYDVSAAVHALWYLVIATLGLLPGALIHWLTHKKTT